MAFTLDMVALAAFMGGLLALCAFGTAMIWAVAEILD